MARRKRVWEQDGIYHVYSRGSNRQAIFLNEGDYLEFEMLFGQTVDAHHVGCLSWSLMPNHWHALLRSPEGGLSGFVQQLNHRYALRFNKRWGRTAHLFANRFGAVVQATEEQFLTTLRYLARNPVEAGLCATVFDARWSSVPPTAGLRPAPGYLRVGEVLALFAGTGDERRRRYADFVSAR